MTQEAGLPDNVVSLAKFREKKLEKQKILDEQDDDDGYHISFDPTSLDSINDMCVDTINELFDFIENNFELDLTSDKSNHELIMFLESYKSLVLKNVDMWHPFQDMSSKIFTGVKFESKEDGSFNYVFENSEKV